jgi:DNA repair exonuclease SbcCD ATPase subunit
MKKLRREMKKNDTRLRRENKILEDVRKKEKKRKIKEKLKKKKELKNIEEKKNKEFLDMFNEIGKRKTIVEENEKKIQEKVEKRRAKDEKNEMRLQKKNEKRKSRKIKQTKKENTKKILEELRIKKNIETIRKVEIKRKVTRDGRIAEAGSYGIQLEEIPPMPTGVEIIYKKNKGSLTKEEKKIQEAYDEWKKLSETINVRNIKAIKKAYMKSSKLERKIDRAIKLTKLMKGLPYYYKSNGEVVHYAK